MFTPIFNNHVTEIPNIDNYSKVEQARVDNFYETAELQRIAKVAEEERHIQEQTVMIAYTGASRGGTRESVRDRIINRITQRDAEFQEQTEQWVKEDIADTIIYESHQNNVNPLTIASIIDVESQFRPYATSEFGAKGMMQMLPSTAEFVAEEMGLTMYNLTKYKDNIKMGTYFYVHDCVEAWSHNNITQKHPISGEQLSAYEMGLMTYNGNTKTARNLSNVDYLYRVEDALQSFK
jgi:soluble lytic murein transglycosylase-like protein